MSYLALNTDVHRALSLNLKFEKKKKWRQNDFFSMNFKNFETFSPKTDSCFLDGEHNLEKITIKKIIFTK